MWRVLDLMLSLVVGWVGEVDDFDWDWCLFIECGEELNVLDCDVIKEGEVFGYLIY